MTAHESLRLARQSQRQSVPGQDVAAPLGDEKPAESAVHARTVSQSTAEPSTRPQSYFSTLPPHPEHESDGTIATSVPSNRSSSEPAGANDTFGLPPGDPGVLRAVRSASVLASTSVASLARSAHASAEDGAETVAEHDAVETVAGHGSDVPLYKRETNFRLGDLSLASLAYSPQRHVIRGLIDAPAEAKRVLVRWTRDRWTTMSDTPARPEGGRYVFDLPVGADETDCEMALCAIGADGRVRDRVAHTELTCAGELGFGAVWAELSRDRLRLPLMPARP